jgi:hypothetical protein
VSESFRYEFIIRCSFLIRSSFSRRFSFSQWKGEADLVQEAPLDQDPVHLQDLIEEDVPIHLVGVILNLIITETHTTIDQDIMIEDILMVLLMTEKNTIEVIIEAHLLQDQNGMK